MNSRAINLVFKMCPFVLLACFAPNVHAEDWQTVVERVATRYDIEPRVVIALVLVESNGNIGSINQASGAVCLMQVVPMYGRPTRAQLLGNIETCIEAGVKILRASLDATPNLDHAISAYNTGLGWYRTRGVNWNMVRLFRNRYDALIYIETEYVTPKGFVE